MTGLEIAYEPPGPMFESTLSAFRAFTAPRIAATISCDPLGDTNRIVRLTRNGKPVGRAVLYPVRGGSVIDVLHETGGYRMDDLFALRARFWDSRGTAEPEPELPPRRAPGWHVEVDGKPILFVSEREMGPTAPPPPRIPVRQRVRTATNRHLRGWLDGLAGKLGYSRSDELGGEDW